MKDAKDNLDGQNDVKEITKGGIFESLKQAFTLSEEERDINIKNLNLNFDLPAIDRLRDFIYEKIESKELNAVEDQETKKDGIISKFVNLGVSDLSDFDDSFGIGVSFGTLTVSAVNYLLPQSEKFIKKFPDQSKLFRAAFYRSLIIGAFVSTVVYASCEIRNRDLYKEFGLKVPKGPEKMF